jgi:hypothetical protein
MTYGSREYLVFFNESDKKWYAKRADKEDASEFVIYDGELSVEVLRDAALDRDVYVIRSNYVTVYNFTVGDAILEFLNKDPGTYNEVYARSFLKYMFTKAKRVNKYLISGFYKEGYVDGLVQYPAINWECKPNTLVEFLKYTKTNYPTSNQAFVLANLALVMGKVFSPGVRLFKNGVFEDKFVVNVGERRIGKTTMIKSLVNIMGLNYSEVAIGGDLPVKTTERIRNLLVKSNAPLFIDDIGARGFEALVNIILPALVDQVKIGAQAERYGFGFAYEFKSIRSMVANTNIGYGVIKRILSEHNNKAWIRRILILEWDEARLKEGVVPYSDGSVLGCMREIWNDANFREKAMSTNDLIELSKLTVSEFGRRYNIDVTPYINALNYVYEYMGQVEVEADRTGLNEVEVIKNMYRITRNLGYSNTTAYTVIKAIINNPTMFDVRIPSKTNDDEALINNYVSEIKVLASMLGYNDDELDGYDEKNLDNYEIDDNIKAVILVYNLIRSGKPRIIIYANSDNGVYNKYSKTLFGVPNGVFNGRRGYSVPWTSILRLLINYYNPDEYLPQYEEQEEKRESSVKVSNDNDKTLARFLQ